jgi:hypothetical protein
MLAISYKINNFSCQVSSGEKWLVLFGFSACGYGLIFYPLLASLP